MPLKSSCSSSPPSQCSSSIWYITGFSHILSLCKHKSGSSQTVNGVFQEWVDSKLLYTITNLIHICWKQVLKAFSFFVSIHLKMEPSCVSSISFANGHWKLHILSLTKYCFAWFSSSKHLQLLSGQKCFGTDNLLWTYLVTFIKCVILFHLRCILISIPVVTGYSFTPLCLAFDMVWYLNILPSMKKTSAHLYILTIDKISITSLNLLIPF